MEGADPDSTTGIGDFLAPILGREHQAVSRAKRMFGSTLTKLLDKLKKERIEDAYELTHLIFEVQPNLMYQRNDKRVKTLLEALVKVQRRDGGWLAFYSEEKSDVAITVFSLQVLLSHGVISKSALRTMFDLATTMHSGKKKK